jgi:uncharacterized delta-60 repeat protein
LTSDGLPDPGFGSSGLAIFDFGNDSGALGAPVFEPDGTIVVPGLVQGFGASNDYAVVRALPNGQPDPSFGGVGLAHSDTGNTDVAFDAAVLADGSIIAGGFTGQGSKPDDYGVTRFTPTGMLDTTFGVSGFSHGDVVSGDDEVGAMAVQSDGKVVMVGGSRASSSGSPKRLSVIRLNPDGYFDPSFENGGREALSLGGTGSVARDVVVMPDGKILIAGWVMNSGGSDLALLRLNPNGKADSSFGTGGLKTIDFGRDEVEPEIALQSDGKIVLAYASGSPYAVVVTRLNADGSPDPSFSAGDGTTIPVSLDISLGEPIVRIGLDLQADGDVVVAFGTDSGPDAPNFAVARLDGDGVAPAPEPAPPPAPQPSPPKASCAGKDATIIGTDAGEKLKGTSEDDVIAALGGNDTVKAGNGDDLICLGDGKDKASGGPGDDRIKGGPGNDSCKGGPGDDHASCEVEHGI